MVHRPAVQPLPAAPQSLEFTAIDRELPTHSPPGVLPMMSPLVSVVTAPPSMRMPAPDGLLLSAIVLAMTDRVLVTWAPPPPLDAVFSATVELRRLTVPPVETPPPKEALLPLIMDWLIVAVADP